MFHKLRKSIVGALLIGCLCNTNAIVFAETLQSQGSYVMDMNGNLAEAENKAFEDAQRRATEKCGQYIRSQKISHNNRLTDKQITAIAPHIMRVTNKSMDYQYLSSNKVKVICNLQIETDDDLDKYIRSEIQNERLKEENQHLQSEVNKYKSVDVNNHQVNSVAQQLRNEGRVLLEGGKVATSVKKLEQAVKADPYDRESVELYLNALWINGNYKTLRKTVDELSEKMPNYADLYYYYGRTCFSAEPPELSDQYHVNNEYSNSEKYYRSCGEAGLSWLQKAIRLHCDKKDIYAWVALAYNSQREYDLAHYNADFSIKNYGGAEAYYAKGKIYESQREYKLAVKYYREAIRQNPRFASAYKYLAIALKYIGDYENAYYAVQSYQDVGMSIGGDFYLSECHWAAYQKCNIKSMIKFNNEREVY